MAAPDTKFIFDDQTDINPNIGFDSDNTNRATFMTVFSSDKGPETLQKNLSGNEFFALYGDNPNFFKHGQPLLQAAKIANAGGLQYCKRVVAKDSKLANLGLFAVVSEDTVQKTDSKGRPLYYTTKEVEGYWKKVTTSSDVNYTQGNKYSKGSIVKYNSQYYQALVDADTSKEEQRIGATYKDVTTIKPSTGTDLNDYPTVKAAKIKYKLVPLTDSLQTNNTSDIGSVIAKVENFMYLNKDTIVPASRGETSYLLLTFTDTGRGVSTKKLRFTADTTTRRPVSYVKYKVEVMENNSTIETHYATFNPYIVESSDGTVANAKNKSFDQVINGNSSYIRCKFYESEYNDFVDKVSSISSISKDEISHCDILFSYDRFGKPINTIEIAKESDSLDAINGNILQNGSNGSFGEYPITLQPRVDDDGATTGLSLYYEEVLEVFNGTYSDDIYDLDNTRIDVIFDANYPKEIKDAIANLVNFREDCFYFRDLGLNLNSIQEIELAAEQYSDHKSKFIADYANSFYVEEPYYCKQVQVTVPYLLVDKFAKHYINGVSRPFCGQRFGITFANEIVDGTINFAPKRTPKTDSNILTYDQKQWFDDNRINYIAYYDGIPTMDIEYTSQERYTQLSWLHNVLLIQAMMHDIRRQCPKSRYAFIYDQDYESYKADIEKVINNYNGYFKSISIEYVKDDQYELNKTFYAVIKVSFKDFIQSEIFKLTMINSTSNVSK